MSTELEDKLSRSLIKLMSTKGTAFISSIAFTVTHKLTQAVQTAQTNGKTVLYNPKFIDPLSNDETTGLVAHEVWHIALDHMTRYLYLGVEDTLFHRHIWNIACDAVNNRHILSDGLSLPSPRIEMPEYADMNEEQIFHALCKKWKTEDDIPEKLKIVVDIDFDTPNPNRPVQNGDTYEPSLPVKEMLARAVNAAEMSGEGIGCLPGSLQFMIKRLLNPPLPFEALLKKYCTAATKNRYHYAKPNRRHVPRLYLPSRAGNSLDHVITAIDLSGSVSDEEIEHYIGKINRVLTVYKPKKLTLLEFDHGVRNTTQIKTAGQLMRHQLTGRGGTEITPVINYANEHPAALMIVFSDGYFYAPEGQCKTPIIWCIYGNPSFESPYGQVVHAPMINPL